MADSQPADPPPQNDPIAEKPHDKFGVPKLPYTKREKWEKKRKSRHYGKAWKQCYAFKNRLEYDKRRRLLRNVGPAREIPIEYEDDPQTFLQYSHHPYAPFTGDTLQWSSFAWDDAATYEGLTRDMVPHGHGVFTVGHRNAGAGLPNAREGDVYAGDFRLGFADGVGMHEAASGEVYKGGFFAGARDGCGMVYNLRPIHDGIEKVGELGGEEAARRAKQQVLGSVTMGTWKEGVFKAKAQETSTSEEFCDLQAGFYKHHALGGPIRSMQHPLHYPHNTLFMAPGPVALTQAIPEDPQLRDQMYKWWHNYRAVHDLYNFDVEPEPGTPQALSLLYGRSKQRALLTSPVRDIADAVDTIYDIDGIPITERVPEKIDIDTLDYTCKNMIGDWTYEPNAEARHRAKVDALLDHDELPPNPDDEAPPEDAGPKQPQQVTRAPQGFSQPMGQDDFDDEDLMASAAAPGAARSSGGRGGAAPPVSAFGSAMLSQRPRQGAARAPSLWQRLQGLQLRPAQVQRAQPRVASSAAALPMQPLPQARAAAAPLRFGINKSRGRPGARVQEK